MAPSTTAGQATTTHIQKACQHVKVFAAKIDDMFRVSQGKQARASHLLTTIITCLLFLQLALSVLGIGLNGASVIYTYRRAAAKEILEVRQDVMRKEKFLEKTFLSLLELQLPYKAFETHEQCLIRGINYVDLHFSGIRITEISEILLGSIDWVEAACAKQHFLPQQHFERLKYPKLHYLHEIALDLKHKIKTQAVTTWQWVSEWYIRTTSKHLVKEFPHEAPEADEDELLMPPHFQLVNLPGSPRRLVFNPPNLDCLARQEAFPEQALEDAKDLYAHYAFWLSISHQALHYTHLAQLVTAPADILLMLAMPFLGLEVAVQAKKQTRFGGCLDTEENRLIVFGFCQLGAFAAGVTLLVLQWDLPESMTVAMLVFGLISLIVFAVPSRLPNIHTLVKSVYRLGRLTQETPVQDSDSCNTHPLETGSETDSSTDSESQMENWQVLDAGIAEKANSAHSTPASTSQPRRLSTDSSFQEDLANAVEEHRAAKAGLSRPSSPGASATSSGKGLNTPPEIMDDLQDVDLQSETSSVGSEWNVVGNNGS
ncbi:hypothetical protein BDV96DRAFT_561076 [Lophiotrema nucula]|uniref:Uncharacterized protein n=1 Tax=Lophiotrema nucula TaxID=690887 RepID=A0A6A5ZWG5_9PLEO|nr:hypothetical protein BDV96DRAFT_561076 [Lophiotrema nucula]